VLEAITFQKSTAHLNERGGAVLTALSQVFEVTEEEGDKGDDATPNDREILIKIERGSVRRHD